MVSLAYDTFANLIENDDEDGLQELLGAKSIGVDELSEAGRTPLMLAAEEGKFRFVELLLNHGANVNAEDPERWTSLLLAAKAGHTDVVRLLLEHGAAPDRADYCGWTPLLWASFKGNTEMVRALLEKNADPNIAGYYHATPLIWAAGRGHSETVLELLNHGAKPNVPDKFGSTPLVWACRKGYVESVRHLLDRGANVDAAGIYSWFPLLVAVQGGHLEVVNLLLQHKPNVNSLDKDGCPPLAYACKEGHLEIVKALLNQGAYVNVHDRSGDSMLIYAAKGGHKTVVEALLRKHAEVNAQGEDKKTALYCAVEKNHTAVVKTLLAGSIDVELATKEGDTPLMKAVRNRNAEIVQLLLEKKAKVSACDKKGDTALHVAMRGRQKTIVEILLRNPKNSQLLYRPNNKGETPYNMDFQHERTILGQLFGARRLNMEQNENLLGYDLYSGALAEMLSEPSVSMPISVGLYAKWGSGKSFLLTKLKEDMKNFGRQWLVDPPLQLSTPLFLTGLICSVFIGLGVGLGFSDWRLAVGLGLGLLAVVYTGLIVIWYFSRTWTTKRPIRDFGALLAKKMRSFKMALSIVFCHPPGPRAHADENKMTQPIRFFFTDKAKLVSTTGAGVNIVVNMIASLYESVERDQGTFTTRLCRAFRPKPVHSASPWKFRRVCCLPVFLVVVFMGLCVVAMVGIAVGLAKLQNMEPNPTAATSEGGSSDGPEEMARALNFSVVSHASASAAAAVSRFLLPNDADDVASPVVAREADDSDAATTLPNDVDVEGAFSEEEALALHKQRMELGLMVVAAAFGCILFGSASWLWRIAKAIFLSPRSQIRRALRTQVADSAGFNTLAGAGGALPATVPGTAFHVVAPDSYLHALKKEVRLLSQIIQCLDAFGSRQSRLVVIVDGLDSCQQDQVLHVLDAIHLLFSDEHSPFIVILAIDPHIVIKAIELNSSRVFQESNISGYDYLHSIVHLPFYLQNSSLRKVKMAQAAAKQIFHRPPPSAIFQQDAAYGEEEFWPQRRMSNASMTSHNFSHRFRQTSVSQAGRNLSVFGKPHQVKSAESLAGSVSSNLHRVGTANLNHQGVPVAGAQDLTRVLLTDDYFNDVNPRSMRRLMNVVYVTGRLLKAFQIDFNWYNLAIWINITEQWPYRTSWLIYYYEWFADKVEDSTPLKEIYDAVYHVMPHSREIDPLVEIDRDEKKLSVFLSFHKSSLQVSHMKVFLPFTINLDPYLRKVIKEECPSLDALKAPNSSKATSAIPILTSRGAAQRSVGQPLGDAGGPLPPPMQVYDQPMWNEGDVGLVGSKARLHHQPIGGRRTTVAGMRPSALTKGLPPVGMSSYGMNVAVQPWPEANVPLSPSEIAANSFQMTSSAAMIIAKIVDVGCGSVRGVSVDGICSFLDAVDGLRENSKEAYKEALKTHNISGAVLLTCSLDDLKPVLGMTFGDWELFKQMVFFLRQRERDAGALGDHQHQHQRRQPQLPPQLQTPVQQALGRRQTRAPSAVTTVTAYDDYARRQSDVFAVGGHRDEDLGGGGGNVVVVNGNDGDTDDEDDDDDRDVVEGKFVPEAARKYRLATVPSEEEKLNDGPEAEEAPSSLGSAPFLTAADVNKRRPESARSEAPTYDGLAMGIDRDRCPSAASNMTRLPSSTRHHAARRGPGDRNVLEKQVTMEDHLIQGALQILSEEAVEDISAVTRKVQRSTSTRRPESLIDYDPNHRGDAATAAADVRSITSPPGSIAAAAAAAELDDPPQRRGERITACGLGVEDGGLGCDDDANDAEGETEVLYLRSAAACPSPCYAGDVAYAGSVVVVPTFSNRSRFSSFSGRVTNSPMSSRSVSVRTLADADSVVARLSPEKNWDVRNDPDDHVEGRTSRAGSRVAVTGMENRRGPYYRGRSDSFPEVGWGNVNSGKQGSFETSQDSAPGSPKSVTAPFTPRTGRLESIRLKSLRRDDSSSSAGNLSRLSTLRRKLLGAGKSKTLVADVELGATAASPPSARSRVTTPDARPPTSFSGRSRSRNNSESKDRDKGGVKARRAGRLRQAQLTYKSVVDSSSTSSEDLEDDDGDGDGDEGRDGNESEEGEGDALLEGRGADGRRVADVDFSASTGYSTLEESSSPKKGKGTLESRTRRLFHMPSFKKVRGNRATHNVIGMQRLKSPLTSDRADTITAASPPPPPLPPPPPPPAAAAAVVLNPTCSAASAATMLSTTTTSSSSGCEVQFHSAASAVTANQISEKYDDVSFPSGNDEDTELLVLKEQSTAVRSPVPTLDGDLAHDVVCCPPSPERERGSADRDADRLRFVRTQTQSVHEHGHPHAPLQRQEHVSSRECTPTIAQLESSTSSPAIVGNTGV